MKFEMEFIYDGGLEQTNPYYILDGDWMNGTWVRGIDPNNPNNVFEISQNLDKESKLLRKWYSRVWDNVEQKWRELTEEEKRKYKISDEILIEELNFQNISIPEIKNKFNELDMRDIMLVQPMES